MRPAILGFVCAAALCADSVSAPAILGYIAGRTHVRRIVGVRGGARQITADAVTPGTAVHPARGTVLSTNGERVVWSELGDAAVLWTDVVLKLVRAASEDQRVVWEMEVHEPVRAVALSDRGEAVAVATAAGIRVIGTSEREIPDITSASAMAFAGSDLLVADAERAIVWRIGETREVIATDMRDVAAIAADGSRLIIARAGGTVSIRDAGAPEQVVDCRCRPVRLERLVAPGLWLMTNDAAQPLWVLDLSESEPRTWFIPAKAAAEEMP